MRSHSAIFVLHFVLHICETNEVNSASVFDRPFVKRAAFVGAQSLPKVFYEALTTFSRREFRKFKTREEAMDWLVREET
jgi:hypothetical protein